MATPVTVAPFTEIAEAEDTVGKLIEGGVSAEKICLPLFQVPGDMNDV
jgi:hypothetical protein